MTEREAGRSAILRLLLELFLPAIGFALGALYATQSLLDSLITGLVVSATIYALYRLGGTFIHPRLKKISPDWLQLGLEMVLLLLEHIGGMLLALLLCSWLLGFEITPSTAWIPLGGMVIAFPIIHGTETALRYYRQLKEKERLEGELRVLAAEAELKALKAQINPHFLFNTLNTIALLIHTDSSQAEATVERLAEMFRYVLAGSERGQVPLEEEIAFVGNYLEIEGARFGDKLRVAREITPELLSVPVPSLILQPLVENAVRHGRSPDGSVELTISVQRRGGSVVILIADQGLGVPPGFQLDDSSGHGLRNVDGRLRKLYGEGYGLEIRNNEPQGTVVSLRLPLDG
jgi:two-component system LytT family sensor kinase